MKFVTINSLLLPCFGYRFGKISPGAVKKDRVGVYAYPTLKRSPIAWGSC